MTDTQVLTIVVAVGFLLVLAGLAYCSYYLERLRDEALDYFAFEIRETEMFHERSGRERDESGRWVPRGYYWSEHFGQPVRRSSTTSEHAKDAPKVAETARQGEER